MGVISSIKRRVFVKMHPLIKRVIIPVIAMVFLVQLLSYGERQNTQQDVLPGEALDPLRKHRVRNSKDRRPDLPFDAVLSAAIREDDKIDEREKEEKLAENKQDNNIEKRNLQKEDLDEILKQKKMEDYATKKKKVEKQEKNDNEWSMSKLNVPGRDQVTFDGHKITERTVTLTIMSSADKVFMSLNKREIYRGLEDRGIHIVVLHPHTGNVLATRIFDTFYNGTEYDMAEFLDDIQDGRIIAFAIRDEAASGLTWKGRSKLAEYGARFADQLAYRDMWILVTRKGGLKLAESYSNVDFEDTSYQWGGPLFLRTDFDLTELAEPCKFKGPNSYQRQQFCQKYDGYGRLCKCSIATFDEIFFKSEGKKIEGITGSELYNDLTVAVIANNRPHYLYKTLKSLKEAPGMNSERVVVYLEKVNQEMKSLIDLFGFKIVETGRRGENVSATHSIRDKIQFILRDVMDASFPSNTIHPVMNKNSPRTISTNHLMLLEEDVRVSVDFFKYLHRLAPVLKKDKTVLGITAFNYNSYTFVSESLSTFYRTTRPQHLALMLSSESVKNYIAPNWPRVQSKAEWYSSILEAMGNNKDLGIIYPEVSRTKHFGYTGHKVRGPVQFSFFHDHLISLTTDYTIPKENINRLELASYKNWRKETLKAAEPLSFDFCTYDLPYGKKTMVVYVEVTNDNDQYLTATLKCLGAWHIYPEGEFQSTWDFLYHGHHIIVMSVPSSPYSYMKPSNYKFMDLTKVKDQRPH